MAAVEITPLDLTAMSLGYCPACHKRGFVIGPRAGLSINLECANITCRQRYNAAVLSGNFMHGHYLPKRSEGGLQWPSEPRDGSTGNGEENEATDQP